jgi:hypothetical protein
MPMLATDDDARLLWTGDLRDWQTDLDAMRHAVTSNIQPAYGAGRRKEAVLWQKVLDNSLLLTLITKDTPAELEKPGMFMHEALNYRDTWRSRLLRTAHWSPL